MSHSVRKQKTSSIKHDWLSMVHQAKCSKNWVSNHLNVEGEFGDYVFLLK